MLTNTFCHIPGISEKTEQNIWASGVICWDDLSLLPRTRRQKFEPYIAEARNHLQANNPEYFTDKLPPQQKWRVFPHFRQSTAYLDIETSGLNADSNYITTIAVYDGIRVHTYVKGQNMNDFVQDIQQYSMLVTYNGKCFDIPFIEKYFGINLPQAHLDLRYILRDLGYKGGLKGCEKQLGLHRDELEGVDGYFAVLLWYDYQNYGNNKALETLLAYNIMDVVNLEKLMVIAYNLNLTRSPVFATPIDQPKDPVLKYAPDMDTINRIRSGMIVR